MAGIASIMKFGRPGVDEGAPVQDNADTEWGAAAEPGEQTFTPPFPLREDVVHADTPEAAPSTHPAYVEPLATNLPAQQPSYTPPAKIEEPRFDETERTVISRGTVLEGVNMKAPEQEVVIYGAVSGAIECSSFRLEKGGRFEGRLITTKSIEIAGVVKSSRLTSPEVRVIGSAVIGYGTLIVAQKYGQQLTARFDARVIADTTLMDDERMLVLDDPDQYLHLPPKIEGQSA